MSVLIPARNEEFLKRTVEDCLAHAKGSTEIIVVLDGEWADPPLDEHPNVQVVYLPEAIGQRAATNLAAKISTAKYILKADAHVAFDDGFDVKLIEAGDALGYDVTQIPRLYNLRAFTWLCHGCGRETYQGPTPTMCNACAVKGTTGGPFEKLIKWDRLAGGIPGKHVRSDYWCFDETLKFAYWSEYGKRPEAKGDIVDVMSNLGALFFMRRERFLELGGLDNGHGSWGNVGVEVSCKTWLSGGRQVVNKKVWAAHLFRTQGGDFGFPYELSGKQVDRAKKYSRDLWLNNRFEKQVRPLSWLIEHFAPVKGWGSEAVAQVMAAGAAFHIGKEEIADDARSGGAIAVEGVASRDGADHAGDGIDGDERKRHGDNGHESDLQRRGTEAGRVRKGIVFYSDCRPDPAILDACREQLKSAAGDLPIVSCTLKPVDLGLNIVLPLERGYLTMARQILIALEMSSADVIFFAEHDLIYHASHFQFTPEREDAFYYNQNCWRVDYCCGNALFYYANQLSGLCAYRQVLLDHFRERVARIEKEGFSRSMGFEPGTRKIRHGGVDDRPFATWMSEVPNIDIRHKHTLTPSRWKKEQFRNQRYTAGWTESDSVPGWSRTKGRFKEFLADLSRVEVAG